MEKGLGIALIVVLPVLMGFFAILVCFLLTLQRALSRVSPHNRLMAPGLVWLYLIPCVNFIFQFYLFPGVSDSLAKEYRERGLDDGSDYGKGLGITIALLHVGCGVLNYFRAGPDNAVPLAFMSVAAGLLLLGLFIAYWIKIAGYSSRLVQIAPAPPNWQRKLAAFDDDETPPGPTQPSSDAIKERDPGRFQ